MDFAGDIFRYVIHKAEKQQGTQHSSLENTGSHRQYIAEASIQNHLLSSVSQKIHFDKLKGSSLAWPDSLRAGAYNF